MTFKDVVAALLALLIVVLFGAVFAALLLKPIQLSEGLSALVNMAFGFLGAALGAVVNFYYGSSAGSQTKDQTLQAMAQTTQAVTSTGAGNGGTKPHD